MEWIKEDYSISTDKVKINVAYVHQFLSRSYWAENIPLDVVRRSIDGSLSFAVFHKETQVGFARVITDGATFAYLADVFIDENFRGRGLSKWLMEVIISHPDLQGLRRFLLATRDAHGLYRQFGFQPLNFVDRWMQIHQPNVYKEKI
ncbi:MAG: GNAT family N-acetyltransferase [Bacteroidota bacterium]|nr:GNAT family N-acetyltransferase [Bacteroidota bacterium]